MKIKFNPGDTVYLAGRKGGLPVVQKRTITEVVLDVNGVSYNDVQGYLQEASIFNTVEEAKQFLLAEAKSSYANDVERIESLEVEE